MCFQIDGKYAQSVKSVKSRKITNVIDFLILINKSEHQCVVLKGVLQSPRLKYHMKTIDIE